MEKSESNLLVLLESVVMLQLLLENLEELQGTHYNKQRLKQQLNSLIKEITILFSVTGKKKRCRF
jgi:hypothetical protein